MLTEIEEFVSSVDKSYRSLMREPQDINHSYQEEKKDPIEPSIVIEETVYDSILFDNKVQIVEKPEIDKTEIEESISKNNDLEEIKM